MEEGTMAIVRYANRNPWSELDQLTNRFTRMFDTDWPSPSTGGDWIPAVNVQDAGDGLLLSAELPGMKREDIEIELENNILTLRGEKVDERTEESNGGEERRYHLFERRFGAFQRSFTLPRTVDASSITADFENGVLKVTLPKAPEAKGRRIEIGAGKKK
jgi:HSP20 family protein